MKTAERLLVLRYHSLDAIPSARWQTEILHQSGLNPLLVEFGPKTAREPEPRPFECLQIRPSWISGLPRAARAMALWVSAFFYLHHLFRQGGVPRLIISHGLQESLLAFFLKLFWNVPYLCDVHEVYEKKEMRGTNRFFFALEKQALRQAQWLIFPERNRSRLYRSRYRLPNPAYTVFNCPRRQPPEDTGVSQALELRQRLGIGSRDCLLLYLGGIGPHAYLEAAVASLRHDPGLHLVLVGWAEEAFLAHLSQLAEVFGVQARVHLRGPTRDRWAYLRAADVSYCLYQPNILRLRLAATASNKMMESMAAGVPVLAVRGGGFEEFLSAHPVGSCLSAPDPRAIAEAARRLCRDEGVRERARQLHAERLNYDRQFHPLLLKIQRAINSNV